jgi:two-component system, NarL family, nitrate/nitrite response regulator NarL
MSGTPLVVTHPCALIREGLRRILTKSQFRPVRILPTLDGCAEDYLDSAGICIWLLGVQECASITNDLVRRVVSANPSVRPVILAGSYTAKDIVLALASGACGFLCQDIPGRQLIKSLELVVLGQTVMLHQFHQAAFAEIAGQLKEIREIEAIGGLPANSDYKAGRGSYPPQLSDLRSPATVLRLQMAEQPVPSPSTDLVRGLSRREFIILQTLTEGASNKIIARKLVITESTVKVHMKAILRKLRLQNRTQAAIWARNHLSERFENAAA